MDFGSICAMGVLIVMSVARAWNFKEVEMKFRRKEKGARFLGFLGCHHYSQVLGGMQGLS